MTTNAYNAATQSRTAINAPNTWTAIVIPAGASDALLAVENQTATWRVSTDDGVNPASEGMFIAASGAVKWDGTSVDAITVYVSASVGSTHAVLIYTTG